MTIALSYTHSPLDLIRARTSVRRFSGEILAGEARLEMENCCNALTRGPFGSLCRFRLIDTHGRDGDQAVRIGTYGLIRGARTYLAGTVTSEALALEDFGYLFELLLLKATDMDLGSCWLGGTFSRSSFASSVGLRDKEFLPAVSPVGVPTQRRSMLDRVIRWGAGSKQRKSWSELFWDGDNGRPLSEDQAGRFADALEMVRLAPSASNRQPWRCLREEETIHFYMQRFPGYRAAMPTDLQRIDMGIAMSHFALATITAGIEGQWNVLSPPPVARQRGARPSEGRTPPASLPEDWQKAEYLVSWA